MYDVKFGSTDGLGDYMRGIDEQKQSMRERKQRMSLARDNQLIKMKANALLQKELELKAAQREDEINENIMIRDQMTKAEKNLPALREEMDILTRMPYVSDGKSSTDYPGIPFENIFAKIKHLNEFESRLSPYSHERFGLTGSKYESEIKKLRFHLKALTEQAERETTIKFMNENNLSSYEGMRKGSDPTDDKLGLNDLGYKSTPINTTSTSNEEVKPPTIEQSPQGLNSNDNLFRGL
jgi:hypothetical protein